LGGLRAPRDRNLLLGHVWSGHSAWRVSDLRGVHAAATTIYLAEYVRSVHWLHIVQFLVSTPAGVGPIRSNTADLLVVVEPASSGCKKPGELADRTVSRYTVYHFFDPNWRDMRGDLLRTF